jgi:hypothetical protein
VKASDGSQSPATSASPLDVPAATRSLDRLVRLNSWVPQGGTPQQASPDPRLPRIRRAQSLGQDEQDGQDPWGSPPCSEPSCKSCSSCQKLAVRFLSGIDDFWVVERSAQGPQAKGARMEPECNIGAP